MEKALSNDQPNPADPDVPTILTCPCCGTVMVNFDLTATEFGEDFEMVGDVLVEVAEQLRRQLHGRQEKTNYLNLADVREMLESALVAAQAGVVKKRNIWI